jgi:hypothetical protein
MQDFNFKVVGFKVGRGSSYTVTHKLAYYHSYSFLKKSINFVKIIWCECDVLILRSNF